MDIQSVLSDIPASHREPLIKLYSEALSEYRAARWEALGTKAGKICEVVYSIVSGKISGRYADRPSKPPNMVDDCKKLEQYNKTHGRSLCIQIPRMLVAAYELRNNRDIGHVGSDVDPNHMDGEYLMRAVQWLVAEIVRVFGKTTVDDARALVESVTERSIPVVWVDGEARRVLKPDLPNTDKVLVLLYAAGGFASPSQLRGWTEYRNATEFRTKVLDKLHRTALIHLDGDKVTLLPTGANDVERRELLRMPEPA